VTNVNDKYILCVTKGIHKGGRYILTQGVKVMIGNKIETCDILFLDEGVADNHFELMVKQGYMTCRAMMPSVIVGEKILKVGKEYLLAINNHITIGGASFCISVDKLLLTNEKRKLNMKYFLAPLFLLIVLTGIVTLFYLKPNTDEQKKNIEIQKRMLEQRLIEKGVLGKVSIDGNSLVVDAIVATDPEKFNLESELLAMQNPPKVWIKMGNEIANSITNHFRMSGHDVSTEFQKEGIVVVHGFSGNTDEANRLVATIGQNNSLIRDIKIINKENLVEINPKITLPPFNGIDFNIPPEMITSQKRITATVTGLNAHVIMNDGSYYFLGAELPTGGILQNIDMDGVIIKNQTQSIQYPH
jgi:hypothetical protein